MDTPETGQFQRSRALPLYPAVTSDSDYIDFSGHHVSVMGGSRAFWSAKHALDFAVAVAALPVLFLISAILIVLNPFFNPGSLFYSQLRIGKDEKPFRIFKFRTVVPLPGDASAERGLITPFGAILRKFRIDEVPQFINVMRGEMSLIGPRPEMVENVEKFSKILPNFHLRHLVRPGLSGLSQVTIGYTTCQLTYAQKLQYDCQYIRNAGWKMEGRVFLRTIWVIATGFGAQ
jgi:lipopolysaccharide/colanic/teichoic acid biosynthesis glycosyltransferase